MEVLDCMNIKKKAILIKCPSIYTNNKLMSGGIYIDNKVIQAVYKEEELKNIKEENIKVITLPGNCVLIPGMIDLHIHGLMGVDTMDCDAQVFSKMSKYLPSEGVTSYLATTITSEPDITKKTLLLINEFLNGKTYSGAALLGINLEGPFISKEKSGAHNRNLVMNPDIKLFREWQYLSGNNIKIVTIAPELPGAFNFIQNVRENVVLSLGHTNCSYEIAYNSIKEGVSLATHLFNAMSGFDHRTPGAALAVLSSDITTAEIIVDKFHINEAVIKFIYKVLGRDRIVLISDAMRAKGSGPGVYDFGGKKILVDQYTARLSDGTLAGSLLRLNYAAKNITEITDASLGDIIRMTSENPAKLLRIYDRKGSIEDGKDADLVVIDENFNVVMTLCMGEIVYNKDAK